MTRSHGGRRPRARWRGLPAAVLVLSGAYLGFIVIREIVWWISSGAREPWDLASVVTATYFAVAACLFGAAGLALWSGRRGRLFWAVVTVVALPGIYLLVSELQDSSHWGGAAGADFVELCVAAGLLIFAAVTGLCNTVCRLFAGRLALRAAAREARAGRHRAAA